MINMAVKETDIGTIMNHVSMSRHREQLSFIEKYIIYLLQLGVYNINSIINCCRFITMTIILLQHNNIIV